MNKIDIRKSMLHLRNRLSEEDVMLKSQTITTLIKNDTHYQHAKCVALFYPMGHEVNLLSLLTDQKQFCFPKVEKDGIHFYLTSDVSTFKKSSFGVLEPTEGVRCDEDIDYMLVPALAISDDYYRIGYGKGYYDAFLIKHRPTHVVGVIYDFQRVPYFEYHNHDQKVDRIFWG